MGRRSRDARQPPSIAGPVPPGCAQRREPRPLAPLQSAEPGPSCPGAAPQAAAAGWPRHGGHRRFRRTVLSLAPPARSFPQRAPPPPPPPSFPRRRAPRPAGEARFPVRGPAEPVAPDGARRACPAGAPGCRRLRAPLRPSGPAEPSALSPGGLAQHRASQLGSGRALPADSAFFFFGVINSPFPQPGPPPQPYRLGRSCSRRQARAVLGGRRPPTPVRSSPVSRCPGSGPVLRGAGAPAAESGRRWAAEPAQSESSVLAGLRRGRRAPSRGG